jgi:hypothetical protein
MAPHEDSSGKSRVIRRNRDFIRRITLTLMRLRVSACFIPLRVWVMLRLRRGGEGAAPGTQSNNPRPQRDDEVAATIQGGESFPARFGRSGFRRNFPFGGSWRGRAYAFKQVEVYAVEEEGVWHVITVMVKYF